MITVKTYFTLCPYAVFGLTLLTFVFCSVRGWKARLLWTLWLAFCCSKFAVFRLLGGDAFYPEFPEPVTWFWNWAYSGSLIFFVLSLVWWHRSRRWALPVVAWLVAAWGLWSGVRVPDVKDVTLEFEDLPPRLDGYRIVQLSDLHVSSAARRWRTDAIVRSVNALGADLVCVTGDHADGAAARRRPDVEPLRGLKAHDGVLFVAGNHEFYFNWAEWKPEYRRLGLRFLSNECVFPRKGLAVAGVNDEAVYNYRTRQTFDALPDVRKAFAAATNGEFRVLLQHRPGPAPVNVRELGVRLQLSGHTHGGIMPVFSRLVARHNKGFLRGRYDLGRSVLYVHPGSGQWAGFPMRFFDPSEITVLTLRRKK